MHGLFELLPPSNSMQEGLQIESNREPRFDSARKRSFGVKAEFRHYLWGLWRLRNAMGSVPLRVALDLAHGNQGPVERSRAGSAEAAA